MPSPTTSTKEFLQLARGRLNRLEGARMELQPARRENGSKMRELAEARRSALDELAAACLPELTPDAIARLRTEARYGRFVQDEPTAGLQRQRANYEAPIREIESAERYVRSEQLLDPVTGQRTLKLERLTKELKLIHEPLQRYENEPRFLDLIECGSDTEKYAVSRWKLQYYRDWKSRDLVCDRVSHERFSQVREAFYNLRSAYVALRRDVEAVDRAIAEACRDL